MDHFTYRHGALHCEDLPLAVLAEKVGTPAYVYSRATLKRHCLAMKGAFASYPTLPCFAVKANSNLSVLREIFAHGYGADLVSIGELERALAAGAKPHEIVFSGVGKREDEIARAMDVGIMSFNVESAFELDTLSRQAAARGRIAPLSLRLNPDIDAKTNAKIATGLYTTKFGLTERELPELLQRIKADRNLALVGVACHIGSQIVELEPLRRAAERMTRVALDVKAQGFDLKFIDMGGGLGIRYRDETPPSVDEYANAIIGEVKKTGLKLVIEPGRVIVGNTGIVLTRVIGVKQTPARAFVIADAAMNDLIRPTLYESFHDIIAVDEAKTRGETVLTDVVGPICETGDILGKERAMPLPSAGDLLAVRSAGAYGSSMASQYNSRPRAVEVLVDGTSYKIVRPRETLASLWADELGAL